MKKLLFTLWLAVAGALCGQVPLETAANAAAVRQALGNVLLAATIVEKDGSRTEYIATANTDGARGIALETALVAVTAGQTLVCAPGDYYMRYRGFIIVADVTYQWNGARLYIDGSTSLLAGSNAGLGIAIFYNATADATAGWKFIGPLTLDGGNVAGRRAMSPVNVTRCLIHAVDFVNWTGSGSAGFVPIDSSATSFVGRRMSDCNFRSNLLGAYFAEAQYWMVSNCTVTLGSGQVGFDVAGANNMFTNCSFQGGNLGTGMRILNATNPGHGVCNGCQFNHLDVGIYTDPNITSTAGQWLFSGCVVFSSGFDLNGKGIQFNGGFIGNSDFISSGANAGISYFYNVGWRSDSTEEATSLALLSAAELANIVFRNLRSELGVTPSWASGVSSPTATYTATAQDLTVLGNTTSAAFTITLPAAATRNGEPLTITKTNATANDLTIDGNASETINGSATIALSAQYESVTLVPNGSNWFVASSNAYTP